MQFDALKFVQSFGFQITSAAVRTDDYGYVFDNQCVAALSVNSGNPFFRYAGLAAVIASFFSFSDI